MAFNIRLMRGDDLPQVNEIDHEAFPTIWPQPNYQRELKNGLAHYIVACDDEVEYRPPQPPPDSPPRGLARLISRLKPRSNHNHGQPQPPADYVFGFAGLWLMAGEAHITNIAVREKYRRQGIGERLLFSLIDLAIELGAKLVTLEVRASNTTARKLYVKYGFIEVGLRRGYYTDNREDGVLMTIEDATTTPIQARFRQLKGAHAGRWKTPAPPFPLKKPSRQTEGLLTKTEK